MLSVVRERVAFHLTFPKQNIAGELIWPAAAELQHRRVPFLFVSALTPLMIVPALFAAAPRLDEPLLQNRLQRHLSEMWGASCGEPISP